jgi:hypothetical protein
MPLSTYVSYLSLDYCSGLRSHLTDHSYFYTGISYVAADGGGARLSHWIAAKSDPRYLLYDTRTSACQTIVFFQIIYIFLIEVWYKGQTGSALPRSVILDGQVILFLE